MRHLAIGYACNLNDIFVRFPYEKCKSLIEKYKTKLQRRKIIKQVFRTGLNLILKDIVSNNVTFIVPPIGYYSGEIHMEAFKDSEFEKLRNSGKFKDIDFLESLFTGYQMYIYIKGKRDNFLARRKFPIYLGSIYKKIITENTNKGKQYC